MENLPQSFHTDTLDYAVARKEIKKTNYLRTAREKSNETFSSMAELFYIPRP